MAVTIQSSPQAYTPSDNPVTWTFSSDETAQANFVFVVEVQINSVAVSTHFVFPEVSNYAHFNAIETASAYCSPSQIGQASFDASSGNFSLIRIRVQERYGTTPALQAQATSSQVVVFKSCLPDVEFESFDYTDYDAANGTKFMTAYPNENFYLGASETAYLSLITLAANTDIAVELFDVAGGTIVSDSDTFTTARITMIDVSQAAIAGEFGSISLSDFTDCAYYIITTTQSANDISFTVYVDRVMPRFTNYRFLFLNKLGGIDSYTYSLVSRPRAEITRRSYQKQYGQWNGTSFEYNSSIGRSTDYVVTSMPGLLLNSDWLSEAVQNWLVETLYESPLVWLFDGTNTVRCKILATGYEKKKHKNDMLIMETTEVQLSTHNQSMVI